MLLAASTPERTGVPCRLMEHFCSCVVSQKCTVQYHEDTGGRNRTKCAQHGRTKRMQGHRQLTPWD